MPIFNFQCDYLYNFWVDAFNLFASDDSEFSAETDFEQ